MNNQLNQPKISAKWIRSLSFVSWGLVILVSFIAFWLPVTAQYTVGTDPNIWLLKIFLSILFVWIGASLGLGLLIVIYRSFFSRLRGLLLFLILTIVDLFIFTSFGAGENAEGVISQILFVCTMWLFPLLFGLGLVLLIYLLYRDVAVRLFAITYLLLVWALLFYIRYWSNGSILEEMVLLQIPAPLYMLTCFSMYVFFIAPIAFIFHALRLLHYEITGTAVDTDSTQLKEFP